MADERFKNATPRPWRIHTFHTSNGEREALHCVGKSMTGRDWTAYVRSADGTSVLETDGATEEEALANAAVVFEAVNSYDSLRAAAHAALERELELSKMLKRWGEELPELSISRAMLAHGERIEKNTAELRGALNPKG